MTKASRAVAKSRWLVLIVLLLAGGGLGLSSTGEQAAAIEQAIPAIGKTATHSEHDLVIVRIIARRADDGRIEFGLREVGVDDHLPQRRFFPEGGPGHTRWLQSSWIDLRDGLVARVIARYVAEDGRTEFGLRRAGRNDVFPPARFFPATGPDHDRWLKSTEIELATSNEGTPQQDEDEVGSGESPIPVYTPEDVTSTESEPTSDPETSSEPEGSPESTKRAKDLLLQFLYNGFHGDSNSSDYVKGRSTGNDWGCPLTRGLGTQCASDRWYENNHPTDGARWNAYDGGHAGWDVAAGPGKSFYSLTDGVIIAGGIGSCNDIAVYDGTHTIVYLHADKSLVTVGDQVRIGQELGTEGVSCTTVSHIHLEVHVGKTPVREGSRGPRIYARGAGLGPRTFPVEEVSIDPLPYLHGVIEEASTTCSRDRSIVDGDLMSIEGEADIFIAKFVDCKRFKRLILNEDVIDAYGHLSFDFVHEVDPATMNSYSTSTLVLFQHRGTVSYYHLHQTGDDSGERRYLDLTVGELSNAGLDIDSVFEINRAEFDIWGPGRDYSYVSELDEVISAQGN